jgi:prepilin-type N-terminal cleavage/methylation domain-containing protein
MGKNTVKKYSRYRQAGFTLIEMIIALSIFVLVILIVSNIYVSFNNSQRKVATMQKLQDDVRYVFETMAQEIRLGKINYQYYRALSTPVDLHPLASGQTPVTTLAIINQSGQSVFFRRADSNLRYCKEITSGDCSIDDNWQNITPEGVSVLNLQFIITPSADPFSEPSGLPDPCNDASAVCPVGYRCSSAVCRYYSDGHNFQPKVRIILKTSSTDVQRSQLIMQSVISSRLISSKVLNNNYD